jgi:hypothetical protein
MRDCGFLLSSRQRVDLPWAIVVSSLILSDFQNLMAHGYVSVVK